MARISPRQETRAEGSAGLALGFLSIAAAAFHWSTWIGYPSLGLFVFFISVTVWRSSPIRRWRSKEAVKTSAPSKRSTGLDIRGGTAYFEDTTITGMDTGIKQTGGELRSKGLSVDGEPYGEEDEKRL